MPGRTALAVVSQARTVCVVMRLIYERDVEGEQMAGDTDLTRREREAAVRAILGESAKG